MSLAERGTKLDKLARLMDLRDGDEDVLVKFGSDFRAGKVRAIYEDTDRVGVEVLDPMTGRFDLFDFGIEEFLLWQDAKNLEIVEYETAPLVMRNICDQLILLGLKEDSEGNFFELVKSYADQLKLKLFDNFKLPKHQDVAEFFDREDLTDKFKHHVWEYLFNSSDQVGQHFELLTEEYFDAFVDELKQKIDKIDEQEITILEVAAGDGRLSYFLRRKMHELYPDRKINVIATDSHAWQIRSYYGGDDRVEKLTHKESLDKYKPKIVISSWMPNKVDFTQDFRKEPNLDLYVAIGDPECCGDPWRTWGSAVGDADIRPGETVPPFVRDGFKADELKSLSEMQICSSDAYWTVTKDMKMHRALNAHSKTYFFERA